MSTASRGNSFELVVAKQMQALGFVVGSRRHVGGAGDLLGVHPDGRVWLVEAKARKSVYAGFTRDQRKEMLDCPLPPHAELWLAYKKGNVVEWVPSSGWPSNGA